MDLFDLVSYLSKVSLNYDGTAGLLGAGVIIILRFGDFDKLGHFKIQLEVDVCNYDRFDMAIK